jgi:hypothetical protein
MPSQLIAGALEHFTCFLRTGSGQAAHRAALLLERLARDPDVDSEVRRQGSALAETLDRLMLGKC